MTHADGTPGGASSPPSEMRRKLLAAFEEEHTEHLEGIRAFLARWLEDPESASSELDEAYRRAHSLKGGARVCDLGEVETLAHRLENVFSSARQGTLRLDRAAIDTIRSVLDAIEDATTAAIRAEPAADPSPAVAALENLLNSRGGAIRPEQVPDDLQARLLEAFAGEYPELLEHIRAAIAELTSAAAPPQGPQLEEACRCAHSLKGAARAVGAHDIEGLAAKLQAVLRCIRDEEITCGEDVLSEVGRVLEALARSCKAAIGGDTGPREEEAFEIIDRVLSLAGAPSNDSAAAAHPRAPAPAPTPTPKPEAPPQPPPKAVRAPEPRPASAEPVRSIETFRIRAENLDRILASAGQLLTECQRQEELSQKLREVTGRIERIERLWESTRKSLAARLRAHLPETEYARTLAQLNNARHELRALLLEAGEIHRTQKQDAWTLSHLGERLQNDVREARMTPAESVFQGFRKMVRDLARSESKKVHFHATGLHVQADRMVLQALKDPVMHLLRNAISHGLESPEERKAAGKDPRGSLRLEIRPVGNRLSIEVDDDGRGINREKVFGAAARRGLTSKASAEEMSGEEIGQILLQPEFSTAERVSNISGRGMGLSVVQDAVGRLQGELRIFDRTGSGTTFRISVPLTISTHRLLMVECRGRTFAIPVQSIERLLHPRIAEIESVEGRPAIIHQGSVVPVARLSQILALPGEDEEPESDRVQLVILRSGGRRLALVVDRPLFERDALIKDLDRPAARLKKLAGAVQMEDGSLALVLNAQELCESFAPCLETWRPGRAREEEETAPSRIMVIDDSFTTRTLETSILESHGYEVLSAVDGVEGLERIRQSRPDLVICDIEMPRMDGFAVVESMKQDPKLAQIPVIIVSSRDRREEQEKGLELGAEAYVLKQKFDHRELLDTVRQFL